MKLEQKAEKIRKEKLDEYKINEMIKLIDQAEKAKEQYEATMARIKKEKEDLNKLKSIPQQNCFYWNGSIVGYEGSLSINS